MATQVPFEQVLHLLQEHGWELAKIWKPYRVFTKHGRLPILIPVDGKMVDAEYVQKIKQIIEADFENGEDQSSG